MISSPQGQSRSFSLTTSPVAAWTWIRQSRYIQHATDNIQHATYSIQHTAYNIQHTTYSIQLTTHNIRHTTYKIQHTVTICAMAICVTHVWTDAGYRGNCRGLSAVRVRIAGRRSENLNQPLAFELVDLDASFKRVETWIRM